MKIPQILTLILFFNLFVDTSKKKRELTLLHYEVLAYLNDETGKPTL